jgi:hypothetical protein
MTASYDDINDSISIGSAVVTPTAQDAPKSWASSYP